MVFAHVRDALGAAWEALDPTDPEVLAAVADLRRGCTAAKEALSRDTEVLVPVALPGVRTQVRLGRAEFEDMIRADVTGTVEAMRRALERRRDVGPPSWRRWSSWAARRGCHSFRSCSARRSGAR